MTLISHTALPFILIIVSIIFISNRKYFRSFTDGALEGMKNCIKLLPTLLLIMCGVGAMFSSGGIDILCHLTKPVLSGFGIYDELLPIIVLRPFSGSAVTATADKMFSLYGADSDISKNACILMGATDTIIFTLSTYFSSCNIKRTRYALPASFVVFIFSTLLCVFIGKLML